MKQKPEILSLVRKRSQRDLAGLSEDVLKDLDDNGIIRIGAEVRAGDILVGKVTPKGRNRINS